MNARKHRKCKQAKETVRLEPKGMRSGSGPVTWPDANSALPVYRANLNHPVSIAEHGNTASPRPVRERADLTARRVRGSSFGTTEEANASGNALDMPTSVWSEMVRKHMEPQETRKSK